MRGPGVGGCAAARLLSGAAALSVVELAGSVLEFGSTGAVPPGAAVVCEAPVPTGVVLSSSAARVASAHSEEGVATASSSLKVVAGWPVPAILLYEIEFGVSVVDQGSVQNGKRLVAV